MRQTLLAAVVAFMTGGIVTGTVLSQAQPAPPQGEHARGEPGEHPRMGWMHHGEHGRPFDPRTFALIYRQADRQLGAADVQKNRRGLPVVERQP